MIRVAAIVFACGAMIAPAAALAAGQQTTQAQPAATATTGQPAQVKPRKDRLVCKQTEEKGSRLGGKRICRTQAEWDEASFQQRQELERKMYVAPSRQ